MLKVHFANSKKAERFAYAQIYREAGVRYALFTVFNFICADFGIKGTPQQPRVDHIFPPSFVENNFRRSIMDSGLFTLMFGAHAGKRDRRFIGAWFERLVDFVRTDRLKSSAATAPLRVRVWAFPFDSLRCRLPFRRERIGSGGG